VSVNINGASPLHNRYRPSFRFASEIFRWIRCALMASLSLGELRTAVDAELNTVAGCAMSSWEHAERL